MLLAKAQLEADDPKGKVVFQFNPESISLSKSANFKERPTQTANDAPEQQFEGTEGTSLSFDVLLDATGPGGQDVSTAVNLMASWTNPTEKSRSSQKPEPPGLVFSWGQFKVLQAGDFKCHLSSISANYTMFSPSGVPLRAKVKLQLKAKGSTPQRQNPTSGGIRPHRRHVLQRGDSLGVIAAREYGDAGYWRQIAEANGIDDPFRLPAGRQLILPAAEELRKP